VPVHSRLSLALLLTALVPAQGAADCTLSGVLAPHRRTGTAVGKLQLSGSGRRKAGPVADLFSATVKGTVRTFGPARPGKPSEEVRLEVSFSCPK